MEKYTPMMEQYLSVKKGYKDAIVFYRLGDFYEMFFDDAKIASSELDLVLTGKNAGAKERVPMCGVPFHAAGSYIQKLVNRGYKVAIVEQLEDAKLTKGIVKRDVIKVVTPGTVIDEVNDEKNSVYIASIIDYKYGFAFIIVEMSTGETVFKQIDHNTVLFMQTILKNNIKEIVVKDDFDEKLIKTLRENGRIVISYCNETEINDKYSLLCENLKEDRSLAAYGMMLNYLESTQKRMLDHLTVVEVEKEDDVLYMDFSTQQNLEIINPLRTTSRNDTLWTFMDKCQSAMGSRLLKKWLEKPLVEQNKIEKRYDIIEYLMNNFLVLDDLKDHLKNVYDLQRLITKIAMKSANATDCLRLQKTLKEVPDIFACLKDPLFADFIKVDPCYELYKKLENAFVENPPLINRDGGIFKKGYNEELDRLRSIQKDGKTWILNVEANEKERTGIKTLKIGYNRIFGYYIEVSKGAINQVKDEFGYIRKQTLSNAERYITQELKEREDEILHAQEKSIALENALFDELLEFIKTYLVKIQKLASVLAEIDCYYSLATLSKENNYVRPKISNVFEIKQGKHPILDKIMKKQRYVANDVRLDNQTEIEIITGPNMGGKSTYMRQVALIVIMAQVGCFVPAKSCEMPLFDKIFTRIGASDDILSGQSTFMVEMMEANNALSFASKNSLILFDEIGRGTSTYDGMALAQAMIEYIATVIHAKTLFSTHYHELTALADNLENVKNVHVEVHEEKDKITFMYKVKPGVAKRSYGINVAKLANLPGSIIDRAKDLLKELESKKRVVQQSYQIVSMEKNNTEESKALKILSSINADDLSPREALQIIYDLKDVIKDGKD